MSAIASEAPLSVAGMDDLMQSTRRGLARLWSGLRGMGLVAAASQVKNYGITGFAATGTSVTATTAAGTAGDIHIAGLQVFNQAAVITPPTGWTQIGTAATSGTQYQMTYWWWKDDGVTTSFQWSWTGAAVDRGVYIDVIRGLDQSNPIQARVTGTGSGQATSNAGTTTTRDGGLIVYINNDQGFTAATPTNFTLRNNTIDQFIGDRVPFVAGTQAAVTSNLSLATGPPNWVSVLIATQIPSLGKALVYEARRMVRNSLLRR